MEDEGPGIAPEHQRAVFTPYFTTKTDGTGMGLAISRSIVRQHRGSLELDTSITTGARFVIRLPRDPEGSAAALETEFSQGVSHGANPDR